MSRNYSDLNSVSSNNRQITVDNIKFMVKEFEIEEQNFKKFEIKTEEIGQKLFTTLKRISDLTINSYKYSHTINDIIEKNKLELEIINKSIDEVKMTSSLDKIKKQNFREKTHIYRESEFTVLFDNDINLKSLYYLILNLFIWLVLWVIINDYNTSGEIIDSKFFKEKFQGIDKVIYLWLGIFSYSFLIIPFTNLIKKYAAIQSGINYYIMFTIYFFYQFLMYQSISILTIKSNLELPCRLIIACEMVRISLKIHAYFREKILYGLRDYHMKYIIFSPHGTIDSDSIPEIEIGSISREIHKFTYFLFCPSLIYRDEYPRLIHYRWSLIFAHLFNFICCIFFYYILMRYICDPYFNFSKIKDYYSFSYFLFDSFRFAIPGVCFLVVGHFLLLHSWLNLWSEILLHGDRRFYQDWWNCTNFEEYYRKWNMVVHEWLYYYIYNDVIRLSLAKFNRLHAKLSVFIISVILHDIIIWISLGFFFPILSIFFGGPGIVFTYIKPTQKNFNIMFWCKLLLGLGLLLVLYLREFNMRMVFDKIGLIEDWHEYVPRSILMYIDSYRNLIRHSKFY